MFFFLEGGLCKEDTSDKLVAVNVFVTGVIYCKLESVRSVSLLPSRNVAVWFGQIIRRNERQFIFSKNEEHRL